MVREKRKTSGFGGWGCGLRRGRSRSSFELESQPRRRGRNETALDLLSPNCHPLSLSLSLFGVFMNGESCHSAIDMPQPPVGTGNKYSVIIPSEHRPLASLLPFFVRSSSPPLALALYQLTTNARTSPSSSGCSYECLRRSEFLHSNERRRRRPAKRVELTSLLVPSRCSLLVLLRPTALWISKSSS